MKTLIIRDSEWLRGNLKSGMKVNGKYCCLGMHARDCGIEDAVLRATSSPATVIAYIGCSDVAVEFVSCWIDEIRLVNNDRATSAMMINDTPHMTDVARIAELRPIFSEAGIEIDWRPSE